MEILRRGRLSCDGVSVPLAACTANDYLWRDNGSTPMPQITLENRTLIAVAGPEAEDFLQSIITTDLPSVGPNESWPGALLTPQGKIMFEFLIARSADGFVIETDAASGDAFAKRLTLYRLRAKVTIARLEANAVTVSWGETAPDEATRDMRFAKAGIDVYRTPGDTGNANISTYTALRIKHGISVGAEDGDATDFFPHDLLLDRNGGLNFKKGCYVGQEVVSRMQHRSTARRRIVTVMADSALPAPGAAILAGGKDIGTLRTVEGNAGLAVVRIDKAADAMASGTHISVGDVAVTLALPAWSGVDFPATSDEAAS
jgi:folate-binding protein YgfZ